MLLDDSNADNFNVIKGGFSGSKMKQNILLKREGIGNNKDYVSGNLEADING